VDRQAFKFFLEHAGYCTPPGRAACAAMLARAEEKLHAAVEDERVYVLWEWEDDIDDSWMSERERKQPHEWTRCAIVRDIVCDRGHKHVEYLASLGSIVDVDASYRRVIEAELAAECEAEL